MPISDGKANFSLATRSALLPILPIHDDQGKRSGLHYRKEDLDEAQGEETSWILEFPVSEGESVESPKVEVLKINCIDNLSEWV